jgi:hypothetical protein
MPATRNAEGVLCAVVRRRVGDGAGALGALFVVSDDTLLLADGAATATDGAMENAARAMNERARIEATAPTPPQRIDSGQLPRCHDEMRRSRNLCKRSQLN